MTKASSETVTQPSKPDQNRVGLSERLSDKLNPILVREVQQFAKGRIFLITVLVTLVVILLIGLYGISEMDFQVTSKENGQKPFAICIAAFSICALVFVPLQVFQSMRKEVSSQTTELLLLSKMSPWKIVRGKLLSIGVFFLIYFSLFAPTIGLTFLLGGVDIPLILFNLFLLITFCFAFSCVGIAMGALCRWKAVEILVSILFTLGLVIFGFTIMIGIGKEYLLSREIPRLLRDTESLWITLLGLINIIFNGFFWLMIAASMLTHPSENRSTSFRIFLCANLFFSLVSLWLTLKFIFGLFVGLSFSVFSSRFNHDFFQFLLLFFLLFSSPFFLFFTTEYQKLSVRVKNQVPKHPLLSLLSAPWFPGGGRGMILMFLFLPMVILGFFTLERIFLGAWPSSRDVYISISAAEYIIFYAGLAGFVRLQLGPEARKNWIARLLGVLFFVAGLLLSLVGNWFSHYSFSFTDVLNPFSALYYLHDGSFSILEPYAKVGKVLGPLSIMCGVIVILHSYSIARSIQETLQASKRNQEKAKEANGNQNSVDDQETLTGIKHLPQMDDAPSTNPRDPSSKNSDAVMLKQLSESFTSEKSDLVSRQPEEKEKP